MYRLSRDYQALYALLCKGHVAVGFVDYRFDRSDPNEVPSRDVVQLRRDAECSIFMGVRGMSYGSIYRFMCVGRGEEATFVSICEAVNLEWLPPLE